jgi:hypothetical protein
MFINKEDRDILSNDTYFVLDNEENIPYPIRENSTQLQASELMKKLLKNNNANLHRVCSSSLDGIVTAINNNTGSLINF